MFSFCCCTDDIISIQDSTESNPIQTRYVNRIMIDSSYTYFGDSIYNLLLDRYNSDINNKLTRSLSPEDDAFFNPQVSVKSTETTIVYGRNYIFPGAIFEARSISDQKYIPIYVKNRNPITVSTTLSHSIYKPSSKTILNPSKSKLEDYVKEMAIGGNFEQNEKFMFQNRRFTFYDEIKSVFGSNINTKKLFSSKKESSTEENEKIIKSSGMYVKFYQASFTVNLDINPLSNELIKGSDNSEPVYINSVTYGRLGVIVFETDDTYDFAQTCINKEFNRIFYKKEETLTERERAFFENTEFKILIIGGDSDYTVQTVNGYGHFLNMIHNSRFTETNFGVPISCTFAYANTHSMVETEFVNQLYIEPLYVQVEHKDKQQSISSVVQSYTSKAYLNFFKNREKTKKAIPYTDIQFPISYTNISLHRYTNNDIWPKKVINDTNNSKEIKIRNLKYQSSIYLGDVEDYRYEIGNYNGTPNSSTNSNSGSSGGVIANYGAKNYNWTYINRIKKFSLHTSPFYIIVD